MKVGDTDAAITSTFYANNYPLIMSLCSQQILSKQIVKPMTKICGLEGDEGDKIYSSEGGMRLLGRSRDSARIRGLWGIMFASFLGGEENTK